MTDVETFCRHEYPRILGILTLYCRDQAVAEELAQEALARAWGRWDKVSKLDNPQAWLYRVSINLANDLLRRRLAERRARARMGDPQQRASEPSADAVAVRDAVASLSRRQRTVIVLHHFLDLSLPEVADVMDAPLSTVKSLARRGRLRLRELLDESSTQEVPDVI